MVRQTVYLAGHAGDSMLNKAKLFAHRRIWLHQKGPTRLESIVLRYNHRVRKGAAIDRQGSINSSQKAKC
jgi:hypothetical protein